MARARGRHTLQEECFALVTFGFFLLLTFCLFCPPAFYGEDDELTMLIYGVFTNTTRHSQLVFVSLLFFFLLFFFSLFFSFSRFCHLQFSYPRVSICRLSETSESVHFNIKPVRQNAKKSRPKEASTSRELCHSVCRNSTTVMPQCNPSRPAGRLRENLVAAADIWSLFASCFVFSSFFFLSFSRLLHCARIFSTPLREDPEMHPKSCVRQGEKRD